MSRSKAAVVAVLLVVALAGCGRDASATPAAAGTTGAASATPAVSPTTAAASAAAAGHPGDPQGQAACDKLQAIGTTDGLYDPDAVEPIGNLAVLSTDTGIRINGQLLVDRAKLARAAKGQDDELSATVQMGGTATELGTYCLEHGYTKP